jgi:YD repeat-containing protein
VTDANSGVTEYTYDASSRMLTIKDARQIVFLTNEYDAQADGAIYLFSYTMNGSSVVQTDVTNPRGYVSRITFTPMGQVLTHTAARLGQLYLRRRRSENQHDRLGPDGG